jgi:hypothetical protein
MIVMIEMNSLFLSPVVAVEMLYRTLQSCGLQYPVSLPSFSFSHFRFGNPGIVISWITESKMAK